MNMLNYKKALLIMFLSVLLIANTNAQDNVGIGTTTPNASAILELFTNNKGLLIPRLTDTERNGIASPANGLIIFNTSSSRFEYNSGTPASPVWIHILSGSNIPLADGNIFVGNAGVANAVVMGGDATITNTGVLTIGADKITTTKILDANVTNAKLATGIDASKLADGTIDNTEYKFLNNVSSNIQTQLDGKLSVTGTNIGDLIYYNGTNWVTLTPGTSGYVLQTNGIGNAPTWVTSSASESDPIYSAAISSIVFDGDVAGGDLSGTYPNPTITALNATKIANGTVDNTEFQYLNGVTSDIQTQLNGKMTNALTTGYIFVGVGGVATGVNPSGDVGLSVTGVFSIKDNTITDMMMKDNSVGTNNIKNNSVTGAKIDISGNENGDLMYYNGTDWVRLDLGTNNQVLSSNGTIPVWTSGATLPIGTDSQTLRFNGTTLEASSSLRNFGSNIGIGSSLTTANAQLHQDGSSLPEIAHKFTNDNTGQTGSDGFDIGINSTGQGFVRLQENKEMLFSTNNTERMRIWNDGQIGINKSDSFNDSLRLWVNGDAIIQGDLVVTGTIDPIALQLIPQNSAPVGVSVPGFLYYDNNSQTIKITNGTSWSDLGSNLTNGLDLKNTDNAAKELKFYEPSTSGSNYTAFKAKAQASNVTYTLPAADGSDGQVLTTDGSGGLAWEAPSSPRFNVTTLSSTTTLTTSHEVVLCSGNDFTITLPSAVGLTGKVYYIKAILTSIDKIYTIQAASGQTIDGAAEKTIKNAIAGGTVYGLQITSDGSNWHIISKVTN